MHIETFKMTKTRLFKGKLLEKTLKYQSALTHKREINWKAQAADKISKSNIANRDS